MVIHDQDKHKLKSVAEHGLCFGTALGVLALAAIVVQWLFRLI